MRIIVTGGAGYIGSVTAEYLLAEGHEVAVVDDLSTGHRSSIPPDAEVFEGSVGSGIFMNQVFQEFRADGVIHFASRSLVGESNEKPLLYVVENVRNGLALFETAIRNNVNRIIFSSSANVYGTPRTIPIPESEPVVPGSPYGESKYLLERALRTLGDKGLVRYGILRYFNAAGASARYGEKHYPETHLIPLVLQVALGKRKSITVYGTDYDTPDGTCIRDYVHVVDLAKAHLLALSELESRSFTYNVGTGTGASVLEVISAIESVTGKSIDREYGERRTGDPDVLVADSSAIMKEVGWRPECADLSSIVESAWNWMQGTDVGTREEGQ